jgi:exodeoxyribonuclease VII large subunit
MGEEQQVLSVSEYLEVVNESLKISIPSDLSIEGEVSDFRISQGKWISFDLKDEEEQAVLKCFMTVWQMKIPLESGMRVVVKGYSKVYERFGQFKLNVQEALPVGEGALGKAYLLLKKKFEEEGLFDESHKRMLPRFPDHIGIITSRDAAAFGDFVRILNNRWSGARVDHAHVHVQGKQAVREILGAFQFFNKLPQSKRPDVLVLTRGGGGLEDLHAFNDEQVARAVFQSKIPVVVGVGHERDESLCDYVADVRASTPSNAAERIVPDSRETLRELDLMTERMGEHIVSRVQDHHHLIEHATNLISLILEREKQRFEIVTSRLKERLNDWLPDIKERFIAQQRILRQIDPKQVLARGYSLATVGGKVLRTSKGLTVGQSIHIQLSEGEVDAEVTALDGKKQQKLV